MLFRISRPEFKVPILCIVSADGCLFLKAVDVWKCKGYSNAFKKVREDPDACFCVRDLVYKGLKLPVSLLKTKVYELEKAKKILRGLDLENFFVRPDPIGPFTTSKIRNAVTVRLTTRQSERLETFEDFFKSFVEKTMQFYEDGCIEVNDRPFPIYLTEKHFLPPKIKIFGKNETWFYKRCAK